MFKQPGEMAYWDVQDSGSTFEEFLPFLRYLELLRPVVFSKTFYHSCGTWKCLGRRVVRVLSETAPIDLVRIVRFINNSS